MDELERKELAGADEATVVLVDKVESKEGKEICEGEVDGKVGVGIADEVKPVFARERKGRVVGICWGGFVETPGFPIYRGAKEEGRPVISGRRPVVVFAYVKVLVVLESKS